MKLLLDEMFAERLVELLADVFPESQHVRRAGLHNTHDSVIWDAARQHGFVLVTKDADFLRFAVGSTHAAKLVYVNLGNCGVRRVEQLLREERSVMEFAAAPNEVLLIVGRKRDGKNREPSARVPGSGE